MACLMNHACHVAQQQNRTESRSFSITQTSWCNFPSCWAVPTLPCRHCKLPDQAAGTFHPSLSRLGMNQCLPMPWGPPQTRKKWKRNRGTDACSRRQLTKKCKGGRAKQAQSLESTTGRHQAELGTAPLLLGGIWEGSSCCPAALLESAELLRPFHCLHLLVSWTASLGQKQS